MGKKALGKSFYDFGVRGARGDDAYHRSRLATFRRREVASVDPRNEDDDDDETASLSSDLEGAEAFFRFAEPLDAADGEKQTSPRFFARLDVHENADAVVVSSCSLARRARKDALRAKRETGPEAARGAQKSLFARAEEKKEKEKESRKKKKRVAETETETETQTPRWTKSGARRVSSSFSQNTPASARLDRRCKACFYAGVSRKRCGSAKAPTFCFLVHPHERSAG